MKKIIGVITTKNRFDLFKIAMNSAINQSYALDEIIIVSDSEEAIYSQEKRLVVDKDITLLKNINSKNYAGSLNTAIHYITNKYFIDSSDYLINRVYIALLDDDDYWDRDYIKECLEVVDEDTDFVISGINYIQKNETLTLSIPSKLSFRDFLVGNPHLQGSNTFVNLISILRIGAFDESMNSTIDRDTFIRLLLQNANYKVVDKHLVYVNAYHDQSRVTVDPERKMQGLSKFYRKYNFLMNNNDKNAFFQRIDKLLNIKIDSFENTINRLENTYSENFANPNQTPLLISFIATDYVAALRLTKEIVGLKRKNLRVLVIINGSYNFEELSKSFKKAEIDYTFITIDQIRELNNNNQYGPFLSDYVIEDKIRYISLARRVLHYHLYENAFENEVIWIVDEDVSLKQEIIYDNDIITTEVPIDYIINKYSKNLDLAVGNITHDPAIPALSVLRTNLVDYYYNLNKKVNYDSLISPELYDYYYDYSDSTNQHLEQPFNIDKDIKLNDCFLGKAISRKLVLLDEKVKEASYHGGNTLIFNKEVLKVPNLSLKIDNQYTRRGDFFWIQCCKNKDFRIKNLPFAVNHYRNVEKFDYIQEINKLKRDLFGSSLTKAFSIYNDTSSNEFRLEYIKQVKRRLTKIFMSFYRVQGLLELIDKENEFSFYFTNEKINEFKETVLDSLQVDRLKSSLTQLSRYISIYNRLAYEEKEVQLIKDNFQSTNIRLLGYGSEANVYTDENYVYKVFHKELNNLNLFDKDIFSKIQCLYPIDIYKIKHLIIFKYKYEDSIEYNGLHAAEFLDFLREFRDNNLVFTNVNARNFRVNKSNKLKLIDYGDAIREFNNNDFDRVVLRTYQLLKYNHISIIEFKTLINMSYKGLDFDFNYGFDRFSKIVNQRSKEDIHDQVVLDLIKTFDAKRILDYGAGKCKIANELSKHYDVSVFDIDLDTLKKRSNNEVKIIENIENETEKFDLINTNLVLCAVDDNIANNIIKNTSKLINDSGVLVLSICNPFYNNVGNTELRIGSRIEDYSLSSVFSKKNRIYKTNRHEYHRPFSFYSDLLNEYGFNIIDVEETEGYNLDSLEPIGEHLVLACNYKHFENKMSCSSHALIIYLDEYTNPSTVHEQVNSLTKEIIDLDLYIILDNVTNIINEYSELLFSKSRRLTGENLIVRSNISKGYLKSTLEVINKYIVSNDKYDLCTVQSIEYVFNNKDSLKLIKSSLSQNDYIMHSVFNEEHPFINFNGNISREENLPVSFKTKCNINLVNILSPKNYSTEDIYLYRKIRQMR